MTRWLVLLLLLALPGQARSELYFKGTELYCWEKAGAWHFSLLEGTNRTKSSAEILAGDLGGMAELKARLARLGVGEWVTLEVVKDVSSLPPAALLQELRSYCQDRQLHLQGPGLEP